MKKKINFFKASYLKLILLINFCFFVFIFWMITPKECLTKNFLKFIKDHGYLVASSCYSDLKIKNAIKSKLKGNETLFNIASKIKIYFFEDFGKSRDLNFLPYDLNNDKSQYFENYRPKNIKGIELPELIKISQNYKIKPEINKEFNNWQRSHGNNWNNKFLNTNLINTKNISKLELLWEYNSNKSGNQSSWKKNIGANPVFYDGILYFLSSDFSLNALNAENGNLLWQKKFNSFPGPRGFLINQEDDKSYLYITSDSFLFKLNAKTGEPYKKFGKNGKINVGFIQSAPIVYNDQIILLETNNKQIKSYGLKDGNLIFKDFYHPNEKKNYSSAWSGIGLDSDIGYIYFVTGNPRPDLYGVHRPGKNLNANSLIAYDLNNQKIAWTFQETAHDLWDADLSSPPILADITFRKNDLKVVIITTKLGNTFVFERVTGKSLFDINYKKTPKSNIPGEFTANFQIFNNLPERFSKSEFKITDLRQKYLDDENFIKNFKEKSIWGWYQPPTLGKELVFYGVHGGNNWFGSSFNQKNNLIYIPSNNIPYMIDMYLKSTESKKSINFPKELNNNYKLFLNSCAACHGKNRNGKYENIVNRVHEKLTVRIPSIVGLTNYDSLKSKIYDYNQLVNVHNSKDFILDKSQHTKLIRLFEFWDKSLIENNQMRFDGYWVKYFGDDNMFITRPPWGEIIAMNIETGKIIWRVPFGYEKINGFEKKIGSYNNGGLSSTSSGIIFANGTLDSYAVALDADSGDEIWKYKMDAAGTAPPILFEYKNKFYVSFVSTGIPYHGSEKKNFSIYTFSIK